MCCSLRTLRPEGMKQMGGGAGGRCGRRGVAGTRAGRHAKAKGCGWPAHHSRRARPQSVSQTWQLGSPGARGSNLHTEGSPRHTPLRACAPRCVARGGAPTSGRQGVFPAGSAARRADRAPRGARGSHAGVPEGCSKACTAPAGGMPRRACRVTCSCARHPPKLFSASAAISPGAQVAPAALATPRANSPAFCAQVAASHDGGALPACEALLRPPDALTLLPRPFTTARGAPRGSVAACGARAGRRRAAACAAAEDRRHSWCGGERRGSAEAQRRMPRVP